MNSAGHACYIERNQAMIDESAISIFYIVEKNKRTHSGTRSAYQYAQKLQMKIIQITQ